MTQKSNLARSSRRRFNLTFINTVRWSRTRNFSTCKDHIQNDWPLLLEDNPAFGSILHISFPILSTSIHSNNTKRRGALMSFDEHVVWFFNSNSLSSRCRLLETSPQGIIWRYFISTIIFQDEYATLCRNLNFLADRRWIAPCGHLARQRGLGNDLHVMWTHSPIRKQRCGLVRTTLFRKLVHLLQFTVAWEHHIMVRL